MKHFFSVVDAADLLGVSRQRVIQLIHLRRVGRKVGKAWVLTKWDIEAMQSRRTGRPKKAV